MSRAPAPCSACARFDKDRCTGYEKPRQADDTNEACPLWIEKNSTAGQRIRRNETISRASAPTAKMRDT